MAMVDIDKELYEQIKKLILKDKIKYPTLKNFVERVLQKELQQQYTPAATEEPTPKARKEEDENR